MGAFLSNCVVIDYNVFNSQKKMHSAEKILTYLMYLLHVAVICVVPALVHPVTDVGSIVPEQCTPRMHYHCIQSVPADILNERIDI